MARAPINGETLRWARQLSHVDQEDLASAVGTRPARIEEFEIGVSAPTFRQLTLIAAKLDRPLGFFFAAAPAHPDVPETADFRGRGDEGRPTALAREMKRAEQHRDTMLDLSGPPQSTIRLQQITWQNVARQADDLRNQFGLTAAFTPPESPAEPSLQLLERPAGSPRLLGFPDHEDIPRYIQGPVDSPRDSSYHPSERGRFRRRKNVYPLSRGSPSREPDQRSLHPQ